MDPDPYDPVSLAISPENLPTAKPRGRTPHHKPGEKFLKGPIPLAWLMAAAVLPGSALAVGLWVWFEKGCRKRMPVPLNLRRLGMPRRTAQRGLKQLANAGLVSVEHRIGCRSLVTLLSAPVSDNAVSLAREENES